MHNRAGEEYESNPCLVICSPALLSMILVVLRTQGHAIDTQGRACVGNKARLGGSAAQHYLSSFSPVSMDVTQPTGDVNLNSFMVYCQQESNKHRLFLVLCFCVTRWRWQVLEGMNEWQCGSRIGKTIENIHKRSKIQVFYLSSHLSIPFHSLCLALSLSRSLLLLITCYLCHVLGFYTSHSFKHTLITFTLSFIEHHAQVHAAM